MGVTLEVTFRVAVKIILESALKLHSGLDADPMEVTGVLLSYLRIV